MATLRQITLSNGNHIFLNPDHVMFVGTAVNEGVPIVNQSVVKLIDGVFMVEGAPGDVAVVLSGE